MIWLIPAAAVLLLGVALGLPVECHLGESEPTLEQLLNEQSPSEMRHLVNSVSSSKIEE